MESIPPSVLTSRQTRDWKVCELGNLWSHPSMNVPAADGYQINPNHRHDEEHEIVTDKKRTEIAESHRFQSFAPERPGNNIKWYVDGRDYYWVGALTTSRQR